MWLVETDGKPRNLERKYLHGYFFILAEHSNTTKKMVLGCCFYKSQFLLWYQIFIFRQVFIQSIQSQALDCELGVDWINSGLQKKRELWHYQILVF